MYVFEQVIYRNILHIDRLHIPSGLVTCIVGESGSGKSTLLRLLNQLISADSGTLLYKNRPIESCDPVGLRRQAVMVPQHPVLFGDTIRANLEAGLRFADKVVALDERMEAVLRQVQLAKELDGEASKLSGGESQRLSLARALLLEPEVYLLDEPSSALDEGTEDLVIGAFVRSVKERGQTLIMVTHSKRLAETYGEFIVEIHQGKVAGTRSGQEGSL